MTWVRLDDHFDQHPKLAAVGPLGMALWAAGIAYCNRSLTDGFIPRSVARTLLDWSWVDSDDVAWTIGVTSGFQGKDMEAGIVIDLLVEHGLFEPAPGGYVVHDYLDYQWSKEKVLSERTRERLKKRRQRMSPGDNGGDTPGSPAAPTPTPRPYFVGQESANALMSSSEKPNSTAAAEKRIFDYAARTLGHERWKLTGDRRTKIRARLRDGYSEEELCLVIDGVLLDPWEARRQRGNDDPALIFRDGAHVDKFLELANGSGRQSPEALREARAAAQMREISARAREAEARRRDAGAR